MAHYHATMAVPRSATTGAGQVSYGLGDLDDVESVRAFAREFRATHDRLDVLIHSAGAIHQDYRTNDTRSGPAARPASGLAFHAMHPGWAGTPGLAAALPGFHRLMGPTLRTPQQGADTIVWLANSRSSAIGQRTVLARPAPPVLSTRCRGPANPTRRRFSSCGSRSPS